MYDQAEEQRNPEESLEQSLQVFLRQTGSMERVEYLFHDLPSREQVSLAMLDSELERRLEEQRS